MKTLGINAAFHDSAAALVVDGEHLDCVHIVGLLQLVRHSEAQSIPRGHGIAKVVHVRPGSRLRDGAGEGAGIEVPGIAIPAVDQR